MLINVKDKVSFRTSEKDIPFALHDTLLPLFRYNVGLFKILKDGY